MKTYGIKISDGRGDVLRPTLKEILQEINKDTSFTWCILFVNGMPKPEQGSFLIKYEKEINHSQNGLFLSLEELKDLSDKYFQMYETIVLGSYDVNLLQRYKEEKDMYKACDVVIELIDCVFWEVYVKDSKIIERLKLRFKEIELIDIQK